MDKQVKYATSIVRDMEESIAFYENVLGFTIDSRFAPAPGTMITLMKGKGEAMIELIKSDLYEVGFYSVGMEVEDLAATIAELRAKGASVTDPAPTLVGKLAFTEDPNGVRICLIQHD
ncbi:VOC family protein [Christensenellaceae bacterium OttesenSCG-928-M15]|nr:VOC family protein [Christensenellaceae bacterium OttesenSCG-928-M15]